MRTRMSWWCGRGGEATLPPMPISTLDSRAIILGMCALSDAPSKSPLGQNHTIWCVVQSEMKWRMQAVLERRSMRVRCHNAVNGFGAANSVPRLYPANPTCANRHNRMDDGGGYGIPRCSLAGA